MKKNILSLISLLLLSSCTAFHSGYITNSSSLSSANFSYVAKNINGKSNCTYILGIGGLKRENLIREAKIAMLSSHPLIQNQALVNLTVSFKKSFYLGVFTYVDCEITADVVEFK